jgi:N-acetylglucosaminyldiphosphoundecaprenol N-acetyl-beta-D-mannosaminyltransferase
MWREVHILGQRVHVVAPARVIAYLETSIDRGDRHFIVAQNPAKIVRALEDGALATIIGRSATLTIADGIGVVVAARWLGLGDVPRLTGIDLFRGLLDLANRRGFRVFLYGGTPEVCERAARVVQDTYPGLVLAGVEHGYEARGDLVVERIVAARPDFLFVALGTPRQEKWIGSHFERIPVACVMGVGGSLDVLAGKCRRAPAVMRRAGMEWLFRALQEPSRLSRTPVLLKFILRLARARRAGAGRSTVSDARPAGRVAGSVVTNGPTWVQDIERTRIHAKRAMGEHQAARVTGDGAAPARKAR